MTFPFNDVINVTWIKREPTFSSSTGFICSNKGIVSEAEGTATKNDCPWNGIYLGFKQLYNLKSLTYLCICVLFMYVQ